MISIFKRSSWTCVSHYLCSSNKNSFILPVLLHSLLSQPIQMNDFQEHLLKKGLIQGIPFSIYLFLFTKDVTTTEIKNEIKRNYLKWKYCKLKYCTLSTPKARDWTPEFLGASFQWLLQSIQPFYTKLFYYNSSEKTLCILKFESAYKMNLQAKGRVTPTQSDQHKQHCYKSNCYKPKD